MPGEIFISNEHESVVTTVGAGVAVCLRDIEKGIGGMCNFLIPHFSVQSDLSWSKKIGNYMLATMIDSIVELGGSNKYLEGQLLGGDQAKLENLKHGKASLTFVKAYMKKNNIRLKNEYIGGHHARKVYFKPQNGIIEMKKLSSRDIEVYDIEKQCVEKIKKIKYN